MKNVLLALSLPAISVTALADATSHCGPSEQIIYSCRIKDSRKVVSLCASKDLSSKSGYLQYRFGRPAKIELEFPKERQNSRQQFRYTHYFRFQIDRTEVSFKNAGYEYTVYNDYDGEESVPKRETGVRVNTTELPCGNLATQKLFMLGEVLPGDEEKVQGDSE
ncbi:MAG: hypothetical protein ACU84H_03860 [Gammaproteobacteria bacterium]